MIVKDIRYIIKRIIIGVGIALILMLIKGNLFLTVNAATLRTPVLDTYRFTYNNGSFSQSAFSGQNADLSSSTLGQTNSGYLTYYFHLNSSVNVSKGDTLYFSVGTAAYNDSDNYFNSTFSTGTSGVLSVGNQVFPCEVSSSIVDFDTIQIFYNRAAFVNSIDNTAGLLFQTAQLNPDVRYVSSYKCYFDEDVTLGTSTNNIGLQSPNLSYVYGPMSFYSRGRSNVLIYSSIESSIIDSQNATTSAINETNDTLNDSTTTDANSDASNFFGNFSSDSHGLSGIVSSPLRLIQSISSSSCSSLNFPLPFVNKNVSLPCMSTIYTAHFNTFLTLYRLITTGLIGYWVCVRLFSKIKDFQNPDNDRIEVLDL